MSFPVTRAAREENTAFSYDAFCASLDASFGCVDSATRPPGRGLVRHWRIMLEKVADSARKAVKLAEP